MIRHAINRSVNYFDTAYVYEGSEEIVGKALKDGYREKVIIATKTPVWDIKTYEDYERIFAEEMNRLQVEYIDIYLLHCLDRKNWESVKAVGGIKFMEQLKHEGKIKYIGFSFHGDYELFEEIIDAYDWDMCQIQLNILDDDHQAGVKGLKYVAQKGVPVVIMKPLKGGLFGNNVPEEVDILLNHYEEKRALVEWAFRWLYNFDEVDVILSGVSNMDQLNDNLRIFDEAKANVMTKDDITLMHQVKKIYESKVRVGCTGCGYCMPCPSGVNIPEIFKVYNDTALMSNWPSYGKLFYSLIVANTGKDASHCIECMQCEMHCPQNIKIVDKLKEVHEILQSN